MYNSKCDEKINVILKAVYRYISVSLLCCTSPHYLPPSIRLIFHQIVANLGMESGYKLQDWPNNYSKTQHGHRFTTELHQCCHKYHKKWSGFLSDLPFNTLSLDRRIPEKSIIFGNLFIWIPIWLHVSDKSITNKNFHYTGENQTEIYVVWFP